MHVHRPRAEDAAEIFARYAGDPAVTRYMSWPTHEEVAESSAYILMSDSQWRRHGYGQYLLRSVEDGTLLGGTGLDPTEDPATVSTGYVFAQDAWGRGYATEVLLLMIELARDAGFRRVIAHVHVDHEPSMHVLRKGGLREWRRVEEYGVFPNLHPTRKLPAIEFELPLV